MKTNEWIGLGLVGGAVVVVGSLAYLAIRSGATVATGATAGATGAQLAPPLVSGSTDTQSTALVNMTGPANDPYTEAEKLAWVQAAVTSLGNFSGQCPGVVYGAAGASFDIANTTTSAALASAANFVKNLKQYQLCMTVVMQINNTNGVLDGSTFQALVSPLPSGYVEL